MQLIIRDMKVSDLPSLFIRIEDDFAPGEYAPLPVLEEQIATGAQKGIFLSLDGHDAAYAIYSDTAPHGFALLSLMAVYPQVRGNGLGSILLEQLIHRLEGYQGLMVEVEDPALAESSDDARIRQQRIRFYEKAGFRMLSGFRYVIWDVPMQLMALPLAAGEEDIRSRAGEIIRGLYLPLMGEERMHHLIFDENKLQ